MNYQDYPQQEPLAAVAQAYHERLQQLGEGIEGIEEAYGDDIYQRVLVFPAQEPDGTVLIAFHGGGWTNGYKEWMSFMAPALTTQGITLVSGGYRLAPANVFPVGLQDCAAVVNWTYNNVSRFGGDPNKLFVSGHSAGGHYAALLAVDQVNGALTQTAALKGCAPISGVYRFGEGAGMAVRPRFLGPAEQGNEEAASPLLHVKEGLCPFFISWGENDFTHLKTQAEEMAAALAASGVLVQTLELPGCDHFAAHHAAGEAGGAWVQNLRRFMDTVLENAPTER